MWERNDAKTGLKIYEIVPVNGAEVKAPELVGQVVLWKGQIIPDAAMNVRSGKIPASKNEALVEQSMGRKGGIDLNAANLSLQIKRDGKGVPLPLVQQDMNQLMQIQGFVPQIIEIKPVVNLPILAELQQKLQSNA
jgi:hypothetical protein